MLVKLCNDDLPLKLGRRLPRPEEKAKNIAEMERVAKVFDDTAVKWVVNPNTPEGMIDATIQASDTKHPVFQERQRMYVDPVYTIKRWFDEARGEIIETRIAPETVYVAPIRSQFTPTTEQIVALNRATESMRDGINRDYENDWGTSRWPQADEIAYEPDFTPWGDQYFQRECGAPGRAETCWTLTPLTDAEVRDWYKDRALGREATDYDAKLFGKRLALRTWLAARKSRLDRAERAANPPACASCGQKHFLHCDYRT